MIDLSSKLRELQAQTVSELKLTLDPEGLWSCSLSWANEAESCTGTSANCTSAEDAVELAIGNALERAGLSV